VEFIGGIEAESPAFGGNSARYPLFWEPSTEDFTGRQGIRSPVSPRLRDRNRDAASSSGRSFASDSGGSVAAPMSGTHDDKSRQ